MNPGTERDLVRRLAGELEAADARGLDERLADDPDLARAARRLESCWQALELPESTPAPLGFTHRVMARVREEDAGRASLSWSQAPIWVRATAAAALAVGITLGAVGAHYGAASGDSPGRDFRRPASIADSYWAAVADDEAAPTDGDEAEP